MKYLKLGLYAVGIGLGLSAIVMVLVGVPVSPAFLMGVALVAILSCAICIRKLLHS